MKTLVVRVGFAAFAFSTLFAQPLTDRYASQGTMIVTALPSAPFPHPKRAEGHVYDGKTYSAEDHYRDSTVAIFVPRGYRAGGATDLIVYFHGWFNNVDSVFAQYHLVEQLMASGKNAVLVVVQGPRNAPDSFGGKLEDTDGFQRLISDVTDVLVRRNIAQDQSVGSIILAGHSGAYHVMSFILMHGGLTDHIKEVYLFDALYGQTEKFTWWLEHSQGKFIDIYTPEGGTKTGSEELQQELATWKMPFIAKKEADITTADLKNNRIIFIDSPLQHNDVVSAQSQLSQYLRASCLADR